MSTHTIEIEAEPAPHHVDITDADPTDAELSFLCSSGDRFGGTYHGPSLESLLADVVIPDDTTHLVLRSDDDTTVCIPLADAMAGQLALELDGEPVNGAPRFVAPAITGTRTLKSVVAIEPTHLEPGDSRADYENIIERQNERRD